MELTEHGQNHPNLITLSNSGWRDASGKTHKQSFIVPWNAPIVPVNITSVSEIDAALIDQICQFKPEIIVLATGDEITYPNTDLLLPLVQNNIGLEVMTNTAAARTFNVLMSEGRQALCLFLIKN